MIDIENKVIDTVLKAIRAESTKINFTSEYVEKPSSFPSISMWESGNSVAEEDISLDRIENAANIRFNVNVYSNKQNGNKTEAKHIAKIVDDAMSNMGFIRVASERIPNLDRSIYQILMQYSGKVTLTKVGEDNYYNVYSS